MAIKDITNVAVLRPVLYLNFTQAMIAIAKHTTANNSITKQVLKPNIVV